MYKLNDAYAQLLKASLHEALKEHDAALQAYWRVLCSHYVPRHSSTSVSELPSAMDRAPYLYDRLGHKERT